jgi:hypothetical protein
MDQSSVGVVRENPIVREFKDLPINQVFLCNGYTLKKVGSGSAKVVDTPLGKEGHKGTIRVIV